MAKAEHPIERAFLSDQNECDLGLLVELEEGSLCPITSSPWGCNEFAVDEGDSQEDFPTPHSGRVFEREKSNKPEVDSLDQMYEPLCSLVSTTPLSSSFLD